MIFQHTFALFLDTFTSWFDHWRVLADFGSRRFRLREPWKRACRSRYCQNHQWCHTKDTCASILCASCKLDTWRKHLVPPSPWNAVHLQTCVWVWLVRLRLFTWCGWTTCGLCFYLHRIAARGRHKLRQLGLRLFWLRLGRRGCQALNTSPPG